LKANEIRKMTSEDIISKIRESKVELLDLRMKNATGALENPSKINIIKKDIARMMTILKEKENSMGGNE